MSAITSNFDGVPFALLRNTADFVPIKDIFRAMHRVNKLWHEIYPFILHNADLSHTQITKEPLLLLIKKCQNIFGLNISWCLNMNDTEIECLSSMRTLTSLNVTHCPLSDAGLRPLSQLPLQRLSIRDVYKICGTGLLSLCRGSLTDLDVANCPNFDFPFFNDSPPPLEHLNLSLSRPTYGIYKKVGFFPLKTLNLSYSFISDHDLQFLNKTHLVTLDLSECRWITGSEFIQLTYISTLRTLILDGCPIRSGFQSLKNLQLERLSLRNCTEFNNQELSYLPITITDLNVTFCGQLSNLGLTYISKLFNLQKLSMAHCTKIQPRQFEFLSRLNNLTDLNISFCYIKNEVLFHCRRLPLKRLHLINCKYINTEGLKHLSSLPLTTLFLNSCDSITDDAVETLTDLPLNELSLTNCFRITRRVFPHLQKMRQLRKLSIVRCDIKEYHAEQLTTLKLQSLSISRSLVSANTLPIFKNLSLVEFTVY